MANAATFDPPAHDHSHDHDHGHEEPGFLRKYIFSTDHKVIGIQYGITALLFMALGFFLMMIMRWSIAYPDMAMPGWLTAVLPEAWLDQWAPVDDRTGGRMVDGTLYNMMGAMHGTIMVFLAVVPLGFGAFGNFVMPLQIGAPDMAFPKLNMMSYWLYFVGGVMMFGSFFLETGATKGGWTFYPPLATIDDMFVANPWMTGQVWWLLAMVFMITSSLLGSVNVITTIINLRAKGMTWFRLPFFVWGMLVTAFLLLLAFPPLEVAALMQLSDRVFGSSFFMPTGLQVQGQVLDYSGGGSPLLYQHLFWFLGHPEVYVLLLPGISIVTEIIANNTRKPLWGYKSMVYGVLVLGFLSFIVWAHHMYLTGMGSAVSAFFQTTTVLISIPSVILLTSLFISLWGGSIRFTVPMLWAAAFLPMFGIGGLTGLPLAFNLTDLYLHDTYYVIAHFHYVVAPGIIFALFGGIYYWYPKATGRMMDSFLGHLHFWPSLVAINVVFMPMFIQGMAGFHRRWYNGGIMYESTTNEYLWLNEVISWAVWALAIFQIPFVINFFGSLWFGKKVESDNPWEATTLEWATPTPPPHGNFTFEPVVYRGPYEYSVPGADKDFTPQWEEPAKPAPAPQPAAARAAEATGH
jgi:cytochrome c oxidase subunit I